MNEFILLSSEQMRAAEDVAIAQGMSSAALMENAGHAVADVAMRGWTMRPTVVLCGPGNNGGDGFVIARHLAEMGWPVKVGLLGRRDTLKGDAKLMADLYQGDIVIATPELLASAGLIVDALFGTGLSRDIDKEARALIEAINAHAAPVLAIDLPSGVNADSGAVLGIAVQAARTVTFFKKKPGHVLFPGRAFSGAVDVVDIGISEGALSDGARVTFENQPGLWGRAFPQVHWQMHKYHRGHVFAVSGGPSHTGAARLAAVGAQRIGAGLVTVLSPGNAMSVNAHHLTSIMLRRADSADEVGGYLKGKDKYRRTAIIGPAAGVGEGTKAATLEILKSSSSAIIDADALMSFIDNPQELFDVLRPQDVLTPHSAEFERLFGEIGQAGSMGAARAASAKSGAVLVLKGADTVIAAPDGRACINTNAPPTLATAGSGDVLAGFIGGLMAQGMPEFEAACAGVWFHGACGQAAGMGLIAEDLPRAVPAVLRTLLAPPENTQTREPSDG